MEEFNEKDITEAMKEIKKIKELMEELNSNNITVENSFKENSN